MTKIKNTKKGMAKKTLSMSLVVAMLATSNVPVWAAEFSDSTDAVVTSDAEGFSDVPSVEEENVDNAKEAEAQITTADTFTISEVKKKGIKLTTNWKKATGETIKIEFKKVGGTSIVSKTDADFSDGAKVELDVEASKFKSVKIGDQYTCELTINGSTPKTRTITITGDTHQEYVKQQFVATKEWGTTLNDALAKQMIADKKLVLLGGLGASDISSVEWYDNSNNKQIPDYVTKDSDISKTYTAKMNLNIGGLGVAKVVLGTVTIKAKDAATGTITNVTWDSGTVDASGNVTFTYDGKTHYPRLTQFVYDGKIIKATDPGVSIAYTKISEAAATDANENVLDPTQSGVNYISSITTPYGTITYNKKLIINKIDLTTAGTLNVGKGFEFNPAGYATVTKDLLDNAGLTVTASGKTLEYDGGSTKDYTVTLSASKNEVGTDKMTVTVNGTKNYKGTIVAKAPINAYKLKDEDVTFYNNSNIGITFTGDEKTPAVTVQYNKNVSSLVEDTDYTVSYKNNTNVGTATVTVTGKGNYTGSVEKTFEINAGTFTDLVAAITNDFPAGKCVYTGKPIDLVKDNYLQYKYRKGTDFTISYEPQNTNVGDVNIKITGQGNYKGNTGNYRFKITARPITDNDVKVNVQGLTYSTDMTDKQITDATTITYNGMTLVENTDYTISVLSKNGKTVILSIKGIGNYKDTRTEVVNVTAKDINTVTLPKIEAQKYSGYDFVVKGGKLKTKYTVAGSLEPVADFEIKDGNYTLEENKDYKISSYENNKSVGTAKINIVGIGAYSGNVTVSFPIVAKELNGTIMYYDSNKGANATALLPDKEYNYKDATSSKGYTFKFASSTSLENGKLSVIDENGAVVDPANYTVSYKDNKAAGTATITVEGKGGYKLNAVNTFKIVPAKLSDKLDQVTVKTGDYNYTGEAIEPQLSFTAKDGEYKLVKDVDYKVEYSDNINAGTAKVKLVGLGNYAGTLTTDAEKNKVSNTFSIAETLIRDTDISATDTAYAGGITVTPNITINNQYSNKALVAGTDYTVEVTKGGVNVGQAEAKIKLTSAAANNYDLVGAKATEYTVNFNVTALNLSNATISPIADQTATGEQIKPAVTVMNGSVKLTEGKDYEVSYGENKEVGEGTVTIKALSSNKNYTGSQTVKFNIVEKAAEVGQAMISDVIVKGNTVTPVLSGEVDGAVGYDYVIATEEDYKNGRVDISKNILKTNTDFHYVQKGTYYAYCHAWKRGADGKKVFGEWSKIKKFTVKATTPSTPKITKVTVKGNTVTVTYTKSSNATGYDVILGSAVKSVNGEKRPVDYGTLVKKNIKGNVVTATFKNVPAGKYYAGVHSFNKTSEDGKKVFSKWSNSKAVTVK